MFSRFSYALGLFLLVLLVLASIASQLPCFHIGDPVERIDYFLELCYVFNHSVVTSLTYGLLDNMLLIIYMMSCFGTFV
jgi:hypothetical protein